MRYPMLALLLVPLFAHAFALRVVVRTQDRVMRVPVYQCQDRASNPVQGVPVQMINPGRITWSVKGGTPPYTFLNMQEDNGPLTFLDMRATNTMVSVTVQDAAGQVATGTGVIRTSVEPMYMECPGEEPGQYPKPQANAGGGASKAAASTRSAGRVVMKPRPKEERPEPPRPRDRGIVARPNNPEPGPGSRPQPTPRSPLAR